MGGSSSVWSFASIRLLTAWRPVLFAITAVPIGRFLSVYSLVPVSNFFAEKIPLRWQHVRTGVITLSSSVDESTAMGRSRLNRLGVRVFVRKGPE